MKMKTRGLLFSTVIFAALLSGCSNSKTPSANPLFEPSWAYKKDKKYMNKKGIFTMPKKFRGKWSNDGGYKLTITAHTWTQNNFIKSPSGDYVTKTKVIYKNTAMLTAKNQMWAVVKGNKVFVCVNDDDTDYNPTTGKPIFGWLQFRKEGKNTTLAYYHDKHALPLYYDKRKY